MEEFQKQVWGYYRLHGRPMPWRTTPSFYYVLVSELMLQQTQVQRVIPKFLAFIERFPTVTDLANAPLARVLEQWVGLGYNRRAKYLHEASKYVVAYGQPSTAHEAVRLPGVGANTAAAIMNYVHNCPTPFVETNIRTVFINHFFSGESGVTDAEILQLVAKTMDVENSREWFWALMDYGTHLKTQGKAALAASKHYKKQPALKGSIRQVRGWIIRDLAAGAVQSAVMRARYENDGRYDIALEALKVDGLVTETGEQLHLTK